MIIFLLRGLLRDHHRSLFPVLIVSIGVTLTVVMQSWMTGVFSDMIEFSAKFTTGHIRIMSNGYQQNMDQIPNDYALSDISKLIDNLNNDYSKISWAKRIKFGGLVDIPDRKGETRIQGPVLGMAIDLLSKNSLEPDRLNLKKSLKRGNLPSQSSEILISEKFSQKLEVNPGDVATVISSTMYGSLAINNFTISGTIEFGSNAMDNGAVIIDIIDAQKILNMDDATGELLGYLPGNYNQEKASQIVNSFNKKYNDPEDEFSPIMLSIADDKFLGTYIEYVDSFSGILIFVFLLIMSIVLWNSGLLGSLRRYSEVGVRLAIGENKNHIYISMLTESLFIGIFGSFIGTAIGLFFSYLLSRGIDMSALMKTSTVMMPGVFRGAINSQTFYIGFIPGLFSTALGTMLAGIGIYKRQTAELFKELEA